MRQIELEWVQLGATITATLTDDQNRGLCDLLWDHLPYRTIQTHALVSGHHLYHLCPIHELTYTPAAHKEDRTQSPDGTVFLSQLQHLAVKYGELTEYLTAAPVGHVLEEDIPTLKHVGQECWKRVYQYKQAVEVRVTRSGEDGEDYMFPAPGPVSASEVRALLDEVHAETQRIWLVPPREVVAIHEGRIRSKAGSCDQYFTTLVFVNGEARPLGYGALGGLIKSCRLPETTLDTLKQITPFMIRTPAEFLGYCGLDTLWRFIERALGVLKLLETKDEYLTLMSALALYTNRLNTWNLHFFPWHHGEQYRYSGLSPSSVTPSSRRFGSSR